MKLRSARKGWKGGRVEGGRVKRWEDESAEGSEMWKGGTAVLVVKRSR
jgi:hypothetical protein